MEKEIGVLLKVDGNNEMGLHMFPNVEVMRKWRGEDSEREAESRYFEWNIPTNVIENLLSEAKMEQ